MANLRHPMWPPGVVETVCKVIASTGYPGLTSSEIGRLLAMRGFQDVIPDGTKWRRLEAAMQTRQQRDRASNCLIRFITDAMEPSRYVDDPNRFSALRDGLTEALALVGLRVNEKGQIATARVARNLDEVAKLAGRLQTELRRRGVHEQVIFYCQEELIRKSLFHAVFEATKGLAARLRTLSGSTLDGSDLVDHCFASKTGTPIIRINSYMTHSERSEHGGFANNLRGVFGAFRNPPAHTPRATAEWTISEADALDYFSWLSLLHRRLDKAVVARLDPGGRAIARFDIHVVACLFLVYEIKPRVGGRDAAVAVRTRAGSCPGETCQQSAYPHAHSHNRQGCAQPSE
jgi:uncharacterized protein (TIGR02391 family)